jgi:hypothetical protein
MMMLEIKKREFFRGENIEDLVRGTVGGQVAVGLAS